jgi:hypothetical protein
MTDLDVTQINIPYPEATSLDLRISVGACRLRITPGGGEEWVAGTYTTPTGALPVKIERQGGTVRITQEYKAAGILGAFGTPPAFDLALGDAKPYALTLEVGATDSDFDLGGIPLTRLSVKQGAGKVAFDFSAPNPQPMSLLDLDAGAVGLEIKNLAHANFAEMRVDGGAASYEFDFGGTLRRDAHVNIRAGMSSVEINVPASIAAKIGTESIIAGLSVGDGFTKKEGAFWTEAALAGATPVLTINASVSLGGVTIRTT